MSTIGNRKEVMNGLAEKTGGGLRKKDLKYNKFGKIVSKRMSAIAKKENRLQKAGYYNIKGQFGSFKMKGGVTENELRNQLIDINKSLMFLYVPQNRLRELYDLRGLFNKYFFTFLKNENKNINLNYLERKKKSFEKTVYRFITDIDASPQSVEFERDEYTIPSAEVIHNKFDRLKKSIKKTNINIEVFLYIIYRVEKLKIYNPTYSLDGLIQDVVKEAFLKGIRDIRKYGKNEVQINAAQDELRTYYARFLSMYNFITSEDLTKIVKANSNKTQLLMAYEIIKPFEEEIDGLEDIDEVMFEKIIQDSYRFISRQVLNRNNIILLIKDIVKKAFFKAMDNVDNKYNNNKPQTIFNEKQKLTILYLSFKRTLNMQPGKSNPPNIQRSVLGESNQNNNLLEKEFNINNNPPNIPRSVSGKSNQNNNLLEEEFNINNNPPNIPRNVSGKSNQNNNLLEEEFNINNNPPNIPRNVSGKSNQNNNLLGKEFNINNNPPNIPRSVSGKSNQNNNLLGKEFNIKSKNTHYLEKKSIKPRVKWLQTNKGNIHTNKYSYNSNSKSRNIYKK